MLEQRFPVQASGQACRQEVLGSRYENRNGDVAGFILQHPHKTLMQLRKYCVAAPVSVIVLLPQLPFNLRQLPF